MTSGVRWALWWLRPTTDSLELPRTASSCCSPTAWAAPPSISPTSSHRARSRVPPSCDLRDANRHPRSRSRLPHEHPFGHHAPCAEGSGSIQPDRTKTPTDQSSSPKFPPVDAVWRSSTDCCPRPIQMIGSVPSPSSQPNRFTTTAQRKSSACLATSSRSFAPPSGTNFATNTDIEPGPTASQTASSLQAMTLPSACTTLHQRLSEVWTWSLNQRGSPRQLALLLESGERAATRPTPLVRDYREPTPKTESDRR